MARTIKYQAFRYTVTGSGIFPTPMLHYDHSAPATEHDAVSMIDYTHRYDAPERAITLIGFVPLGYKPEPTAARWLTFRWRVVAGSIRRIEE